MESQISSGSRTAYRSTEPGKASASRSSLPKPHNDIGGGLHLTRFDLATAQRENLEQCNGLLRLLVAVDILQDHLGFTVLSDNQGFPPVPERAHDLGGMGLEVADGFDPVGQFPRYLLTD